MPKSSLEVLQLEDRTTPGKLNPVGKIVHMTLLALPPADPTSPPTTGGGTGTGTPVVVTPPPPVSPPVQGKP